MAITVHNLQHRLQLEDLNFSDFQAKVITAQMDAAQDGVLTEEEIDEASAKDIVTKLKATPQHLAELKALEIALEYEQAKISEAQRSQERIRSVERLRTKRTQNEVDNLPTSPAYSKTSTLTRSPRMNESRSSAGFGSTEPRSFRMGVGRQNNLASKIGRFSLEELRETSTKTKREHERETTMTDYFRLHKELEVAQQQNVEMQLKLNKVVDENQQTMAKAQTQMLALEKEKARLAKVNRVYSAGYGSIVSKLNELQVKSQKLVPGVMGLKNGRVTTDFCDIDRSIARLLDSVKQSISEASEIDVQPQTEIPSITTSPDAVASKSSSNQASIGLQKIDVSSFARRNPMSAMKQASPPPVSPSATKQRAVSDSTAADKKDLPSGYGKFLEVRKGVRPTAKSASQTDLDDMMRDLFVESCQAAATTKLFVSADGLYMNSDQFMKLLDAARLLDDNVKAETVQPLFTKVVNHANVGKKKFKNRVDLKGMIDLMKEVAYIKFPTLSEAGRWNRIQRSYLFRLREDLFATQTVIDGPAASMSSSSSGGMARPQVIAFMQKHREPLLKMFRRFAHLGTGGGGNSMRKGNATLSAKALQSLAEEYGIVPGLIDVKRILELRPGSDADETFDFSAFCDWLGALAMSLYSSGYDDLAPEGFALEYPSLELKIQRLFYDIDKRGVIFDLRGMNGKKKPFVKKRGAANAPTKGLKAQYMIMIDDNIDRKGVTFELRGSDGQAVPFSKKRIENSMQGLKSTITQNFSDPKPKSKAIRDPKQKETNANTENAANDTEEKSDEAVVEEAQLRQAKVLFRTKAGTDGHLDKDAFVSLAQSMLEAGVLSADAPSAADLKKAFEDEDVEKSGFVDVDGFAVIYDRIQAGKVKGIGSSVATSWLGSGVASWLG